MTVIGSTCSSLPRQAVILVGGLGTRLGSLTSSTPKPLLEVAGRPFLLWLIDELARHQITNILLLAGFAGEQIATLAGGREGVTVSVEPSPLGTGGALAFAADLLDEHFFLLNGDSFFDVNLWDLAGRQANTDATLALREVTDAGRYGVAVLNGNLVSDFEPGRRGRPGLINGGVSVCSRHIVDGIARGVKVSLEQEIYPRLAATGRLGGRSYDRPFLDIGVPDDFVRSQTWLRRATTRGAVIFDRDGVLNRDIGYAHRPDQIEWVDGAIDAVKAVNDAGWFAFVATNQAGVARGFYDEGDVDALHRWMNEQLMARGAHIDTFVHSPFHPDGKVAAFRAVTDCRKPGPGMILDLLDRHPVDRGRALMVGDKISDVEAAEAAGIRGVLFEGGRLDGLIRHEMSKFSSN